MARLETSELGDERMAKRLTDGQKEMLTGFEVPWKYLIQFFRFRKIIQVKEKV